MICPICSSEMSESIEELFALPSIISDCRAWSDGRSVEVCSGCGVMHRVTRADFSGVYKGYVSYPEPTGRTKKILEFARDKIPSPKRILDVGCGTGQGMRLMAEFFPDSIVFGHEPTINIERPKDKFDLITLFHVLEHVEDLGEMLSYIKGALTDSGHVLIQVPYTALTPFDLVIADHIWHFSINSLVKLFIKNGFFVEYGGHDVFKKELTLWAVDLSTGRDCICDVRREAPNDSVNHLLSYKAFLDTIDQPVAVFGTNPIAAWAGNILGDKAAYYLDDDASRHGTFNNRVVLAPAEDQLPVVAPFPSWQLPAIKEKHPELRFL